MDEEDGRDERGARGERNDRDDRDGGEGREDGYVADLHVHTTASDGELTLEALPDAARRAGVSWVAVTDHDRLHPGLDAPVVDMEGVTVVRGVELRVSADSGNVDLLGYAAEETPALAEELDRIQRNRRERAAEIVDRVERLLGVELPLELEEGVGRPHIARAIATATDEYDYQRAFDELIGNDGPCYVQREIPTFERGSELLREACAVVSLAHPYRYPNVSAALALTRDLDAVEREYPYGFEVNLEPIERAVEAHDLLVTGGSDAHDDVLGRGGLNATAFEEFRRRIART